MTWCQDVLVESFFLGFFLFFFTLYTRNFIVCLSERKRALDRSEVAAVQVRKCFTSLAWFKFGPPSPNDCSSNRNPLRDHARLKLSPAWCADVIRQQDVWRGKLILVPLSRGSFVAWTVGVQNHIFFVLKRRVCFLKLLLQRLNPSHNPSRRL